MKIKLTFKTNAYVHSLMVVSIVLAASSFPIGAMITHALPPEVMMFFRFLLASVLFAPYVIVKHGLKMPPLKTMVRYGVLSIPLVVFFWCMFESLRYTSVLNTGALYTTVPAITAIFALLINGEVLGKVRSVGLAVGTLGALWIVFRGSIDAFINLDLNYGDFVFFSGCVVLGFYNPLVKRFHRGEPTEVMTFWVLLLGSLWLLIGSGKGIIHVDWFEIKYTVYGGIIYLAVFSTLITFSLLHYCTVRLGATKTSAYGFLTPVFVVVISILVGMEEFEVVVIPGLLMIVVAMFMIQRGDSDHIKIIVKKSRYSLGE